MDECLHPLSMVDYSGSEGYHDYFDTSSVDVCFLGKRLTYDGMPSVFEIQSLTLPVERLNLNVLISRSDISVKIFKKLLLKIPN